MPTRLWVRDVDRAILESISKVGINKYNDNISTGVLENDGSLNRIMKEFVLGRTRRWKQSANSLEFVRIDYMHLYPNGLILTPYSDIDVRYHLSSKNIEQNSPIERVELRGSDHDDFVDRAFGTYYHPIVSKHEPKDFRFILCDTRWNQQ